MWRRYTIIFTLVLVVVLTAWDVWVAVTPEERDTISAVLLDFSRARVGFAWGLGALGGHLVWPTSKKRPRWAIWALPFALLGLVLLFVLVPSIPEAVFRNPAGAFIFGFPFGRLLWPQYRPDEDGENAATRPAS